MYDQRFKWSQQVAELHIVRSNLLHYTVASYLHPQFILMKP